MQTQSLPQVWAQNSSLEMAWSRVLAGDRPTISGERVAPFFTEGAEGFSIDYPEDFQRAEELLAAGGAELPAKVFRFDIATGRKELWRTLMPADAAGIYSLDVLPRRGGDAYVYSFNRILSDLYLVEGVR